MERFCVFWGWSREVALFGRVRMWVTVWKTTGMSWCSPVGSTMMKWIGRGGVVLKWKCESTSKLCRTKRPMWMLKESSELDKVGFPENTRGLSSSQSSWWELELEMKLEFVEVGYTSPRRVEMVHVNRIHPCLTHPTLPCRHPYPYPCSCSCDNARDGFTACGWSSDRTRPMDPLDGV